MPSKDESNEQDVTPPAKPKRKYTKKTPVCAYCGKEFNEDNPPCTLPEDKTKKPPQYCKGCLRQGKIIFQEKEAGIQLRDYIFQAYGEAYWGQRGFAAITQQIESMKNKFSFTYWGMLIAIRYYHEDLGHDWPETPSVGIIPYVYEEASREYRNKRGVEKHYSEIDIPAILSQERHIVIPPRPPASYEFLHKKLPQIDLDDLGGVE
jgi:hypothetical protein